MNGAAAIATAPVHRIAASNPPAADRRPPTMDLEGQGVLHFWIPRRDLARGRFDRVEGSWETD
jgi:hypothetical protein